jgi:hypothetical protein
MITRLKPATKGGARHRHTPSSGRLGSVADLAGTPASFRRVVAMGSPRFALSTIGGFAARAMSRDWIREACALLSADFGPPNGSHAKLCGRFRAPKPERRAGCRD